MRPVKVYQIVQKDAMVCGREHVFHLYNPDPNLSVTPIPGNPEGKDFLVCNAKEIRVPIHHLREYYGPHPMAQLADPTPWIKDFYIAVEPALEEFLTISYQSQIRQAHKELDLAKENIARLMGEKFRLIGEKANLIKENQELKEREEDRMVPGNRFRFHIDCCSGEIGPFWWNNLYRECGWDFK